MMDSNKMGTSFLDTGMLKVTTRKIILYLSNEGWFGVCIVAVDLTSNLDQR